MFAGWDRRRLVWGLTLGFLGIGILLLLNVELIPNYLEDAAHARTEASPAPMPIHALALPSSLPRPTSSPGQSPAMPEPDLNPPPEKQSVSGQEKPSQLLPDRQLSLVPRTKTVMQEIHSVHQKPEKHPTNMMPTYQSPERELRQKTPRPSPGQKLLSHSRSKRFLCRVHFSTANWHLGDTATAMLQKQATLGQLGPGQRYLVVGHSDQRGELEHNRLLGQKRAEMVVAYLVRLGVPKSRIEPPQTLGSERPIKKAGGDQSWARNRRVEVFVVE